MQLSPSGLVTSSSLSLSTTSPMEILHLNHHHHQYLYHHHCLHHYHMIIINTWSSPSGLVTSAVSEFPSVSLVTCSTCVNRHPHRIFDKSSSHDHYQIIIILSGHSFNGGRNKSQRTKYQMMCWDFVQLIIIMNFTF